MKTYRLVTGFYPSSQTADKVLKKAKGNCKEAYVEKINTCYTVVLAESMSYDEIDRKFEELIEKKVYCGIIFSYDI